MIHLLKFIQKIRKTFSGHPDRFYCSHSKLEWDGRCRKCGKLKIIDQ